MRYSPPQKTSSSSSSGIGFFGLLTVCFIVLKLCNVIDWHWKWVLAPIWIPFSIGVIILLIVLIVSNLRS